MFIFKYYRENHYLEKAIRYDELYFSSNAQLNDPLDLKINTYFGDNESIWREVLKSRPQIKTWDLSHYIDVECEDFISDINKFFRNLNLTAEETIKSILDKHKLPLMVIFEKHIQRSLGSPKVKYSSEAAWNDSEPNVKAELCVQFMVGLLSPVWAQRFYSCSFSIAALEPMMWAHYADGFKGCVLIYSTDSDKSLKLKPHPCVTEYLDYGFDYVTYCNNDKKVDLLELFKNRSIVTIPLLFKSQFWSYERELRILLSQNFSGPKLFVSPEMPQSLATRIFHHHPKAIQGVIFGPKSPDSFKATITAQMAEKLSYNFPPFSVGFYVFESILTTDGRLTVSSGALCTVSKPGDCQVMKKILEGDLLAEALFRLGIEECKPITV